MSTAEKVHILDGLQKIEGKTAKKSAQEKQEKYQNH